jgi:hypothetical protein
MVVQRLLCRVVFWLCINTSISEEYTASIFSPEDGCIMFLRNAGIHLKVYKAE